MSTPRFYFPTLGIGTERCAMLLAIDDAALPLRKHLCLYLTTPTVRAEPVLMPADDANAPDSSAAHFYGTVLFDEGRFRMWYYACYRGPNPDWTPEAMAGLAPCELDAGPLCYAESDDGIHWHKPALQQLLFKGSRENNALALPDAKVSCATVIKDDEDPDPRRRYKMVYERFWKPTPGRPSTDIEKWGNTMRTATSADGLHWQVNPDRLVDDAVEHAGFYKFNGLYIVNAQAGTQCAGEGGKALGRQGFAWISTDFDHWLQECAAIVPAPRTRAGGAALRRSV